MSDKVHVASGAVVMLCLGTFRYGGHCVTASEVIGEEVPTAPSTRGIPSSSDRPPRLVGGASLVSASVPWSRVLPEMAPLVGLDLAPLALDELTTTTPAVLNFVNFGEVRCPNIIDISRDVTGWNALKNGDGIDCAPIIVLGLGSDDGLSMRHGERDTPIAWFAGECLHLRARCTFIACRDDACVAETHASFRDTYQAKLTPYLRDFLASVVHQSAPPVGIAQPGAVDGRPIVTFASSRPADTRRVDHDSSSVRQIRQ